MPFANWPVRAVRPGIAPLGTENSLPLGSFPTIIRLKQRISRPSSGSLCKKWTRFFLASASRGYIAATARDVPAAHAHLRKERARFLADLRILCRKRAAATALVNRRPDSQHSRGAPPAASCDPPTNRPCPHCARAGTIVVNRGIHAVILSRLGTWRRPAAVAARLVRPRAAQAQRIQRALQGESGSVRSGD